MHSLTFMCTLKLKFKGKLTILFDYDFVFSRTLQIGTWLDTDILVMTCLRCENTRKKIIINIIIIVAVVV